MTFKTTYTATVYTQTSPMQTSFDWCKSTAAATPSKSYTTSTTTSVACL